MVKNYFLLIIQLFCFFSVFPQASLFKPHFPQHADATLWEAVLSMPEKNMFAPEKADSILRLSMQNLTDGIDPEAHLMVLSQLADNYGRMGRNPAKGLEILETSGALYQQKHDTLSIGWAFRYSMLAYNSVYTRNAPGIAINFEKAYNVLVATDSDHPLVPALQYNVMQALFQVRKIVEGFEYFSPLVEYAEKNNDWFQLINAYLAAGNIIKFYNPGLGRQFLQYSLFLAEKYNVTRHLNDPFFYISLGSANTATDHHQEAMQLYKTGLEVLRQYAPQNKSLETNFLYYIGVSYGNLDQFAPAITYLDSSATLEKTLAGKSNHWYRTMGLKGKNLNFAERYAEAKEVNQEVFNYFASSGAEYNSYYYQGSIQELMKSHAGLGQYQEALGLGQRALFNFFGMDPPEDLYTLPELSQLLSTGKNYLELEEAIYLKIDILREMAYQGNEQELVEHMLRHFEAAATITDMHASVVANAETLTSLSARFKLNANKLLDGLATLQANQMQMQEAYRLVARSKAYLLQTENARNQIYAQAIASEKLSLRSDLSIELLKISPEKNPEQWEHINRQLLAIEKNNFVAGIVNPSDPKPLTANTLNISQGNINTNIHPNELVVDFYISTHMIHTFFVGNDSFQAISKPLPDDFNELTSNLFRSIKTGNQNSVNHLARSLGKVLFEGADTRMQKEHAIIVPDEKLHALPFDILYFKDKPLLESMAVSYRYTSHLYRDANAEEMFRPQSFLAMAPAFDVGQPVFDGFASTREEERGEIFREGGSFTPLPATLEEIEEIENLVAGTGMQTRTFERLEATMENFFTYAESYDVIHLATHGVSNITEPSKSGLALFYKAEDDENSQHPGSGLLMLGELSGLTLKADLVVLSACKSGYGTIQRGEGIMGISRGFISAGANHVVASLWKVHDQKTREFMTSFYRFITQGYSYHEALRLAKLEKSAKGWLTVDWSGFILIGG